MVKTGNKEMKKDFISEARGGGTHQQLGWKKRNIEV